MNRVRLSASLTQGLFARPLRALSLAALILIAEIAFEAIAVTTAMPTVARALDGVRLYAIAFGITFATSMIGMVLSGQWSDARGPAAPLMAGIAWFVAGLLASGFAHSMLGVIVGRAMQGFGSGQVIVALYVVIARAYPSELRPAMFAAIAGAWVIPALIGPLVAGVVVQFLSWRWVFLGVAVLVLPGAVLARVALKDCVLHDDADAAAFDGTGRRSRNVRRLLLAIGAALSTGLLHFAGQQHSAGGAILLCASFAGVFLFGMYLLPRGALTLRTGLPSVIALRGISAGAYIAAEVFVPLVLSMKRGLSPAQSALSLTAGGVLWAVGSWYQARPKPRLSQSGMLRLGMALTSVGIAISALVISPSVPPATALLGWSFAGFGLGLVYPTLSVLTLKLSRREEQGDNSSALQLADAMFSTAALALSGALFAALIDSAPSAAYLGAFMVALLLALIGTAMAGRTCAAQQVQGVATIGS